MEIIFGWGAKMVKAEISTKNGTKIVIEGNPAEVRGMLEQLGYSAQQTTDFKSANKKISVDPASLLGHLLHLKDEQFFDQPRGISEIRAALAQKAHFYPLQSISTTLIRAVKKGIFGRVPGPNGWLYVKR